MCGKVLPTPLPDQNPCGRLLPASILPHAQVFASSPLRTARATGRSIAFDALPRGAPRPVPPTMKNADLSPLGQAWESLWKRLQPLFAEHAFLTIICAFFAGRRTLRFHRFLRSLRPGLVAFILLLIFGILPLPRTSTRTEPPFRKPVIDGIAPFFPMVPNDSVGVKTPSPSNPRRRGRRGLGRRRLTACPSAPASRRRVPAAFAPPASPQPSAALFLPEVRPHPRYGASAP